MVSQYQKPYNRTKTKIRSYGSTFREGTEAPGTWRVATIQSVFIGQAPISLLHSPAVSPSPVSREASRDFVALHLWLHTRYQISKVNVWCHIAYLVHFYFWVWIGWVGYNVLLSGLGEQSDVMPYIILFYFEVIFSYGGVVRFVFVCGRHWPESLSYSSGINILMATLSMATPDDLSVATPDDLQRHYF